MQILKLTSQRTSVHRYYILWFATNLVIDAGMISSLLLMLFGRYIHWHSIELSGLLGLVSGIGGSVWVWNVRVEPLRQNWLRLKSTAVQVTVRTKKIAT